MATTTLSTQSSLPPNAMQHFNSDGPRKKRKYIPGGPGGGGHWIEVNMTPAEIEATEAREKRIARRRSSWKERTREAAPATATRPRREAPPPAPPPSDKPTFDSAADAVALVDGYKPREERSWEEFHPDLDLEAKIQVFSADEVDGIAIGGGAVGSAYSSDAYSRSDDRPVTPSLHSVHLTAHGSTPKRKPGRPPGRRTPGEGMLKGIGSNTPPTPRPMPIPVQNPRERLNLPKPSYRDVPSLDAFEQDKAVRQNNFVTKTMEGLGYQKTDRFARDSQHEMIRLEQRSKDEELEPLALGADHLEKKPMGVRPTAQVEYDMDEQDEQWLEELNKHRRYDDKVEIVLPAVFEVTMTQIEKEWHALEKRIPKPNPKPPQTHRPRSSSSAAVNGEPPAVGEEGDSKCAVCDDGDCENTNAIVFCDGCDLAVHQECYGVPYIPEGQWLCRKCQQVGKSLPTCIFCPNTDGAFKMTTESKWAHIACSVWIPEVTIGNASFMEPIMGVADVQKARWKLNCYICSQRMGACIQCANRNCYQAFHVTCARRAKLCLKMKSMQGGPATLDPSTLKAFCDKHVPPDWKSDHDVEAALADAKTFYRREMRDRRWADSQEAALSFVPSQQNQPAESIEDLKNQDDVQGAGATPGQKKKRLEMQKRIWRLPSGAPIVPLVIFNAVDSAMQKFNPFPKRKEFVAEACKYWSLKREARRGASLLKRLQLQMETFTTSEIGRRDFAAMGPAGGPRLQRRIDFAKQLEREMFLVQKLCNDLREREAKKLQDAEALADLVNTIYFPITALLRPVLDRAKRLDEKTSFFTVGLAGMQQQIDHRAYTSVAAFSAELSSILQDVPAAMEHEEAGDYTKRIQEMSKVAKRILHQTNAGGMLRDAMQSEADLARKPYEQELKDLEEILNPPFSGPVPANASRPTVAAAQDEGMDADGDTEMTVEGGQQEDPTEFVDNRHATIVVDTTNIDPLLLEESDKVFISMNGAAQDRLDHDRAPGPETCSEESSATDLLAPLRDGGIPWYFERFDPSGTTIHDERWDGADRAISAELSDIDEQELTELGINVEPDAPSPVVVKKAAPKKRKRNW